MSRIGKVPIKLPQGVQVKVGPDKVVAVKGPKGEVAVETQNHVSLDLKGDTLHVGRHSDEMQDRAFHGLYHRMLTNAIAGVTKGYTKELELQGVGYKAEVRGKELVLNVGKSHEVKHQIAAGVTISTPNPTRIVLSSSDKYKVGQEAARIRAVAPPEPYKGKGIRYVGEIVRRKVGKSGAK
ncbi:50S ribosomal protein L6 [Candidatus Sumerlaeota bacterium]|nr:50S ribosomal protein L6 [Candidatus Sumerlaeota bacterium]MBI3735145.1 50S ribosomal protein L6 [Candidatus Sumerlaeota bacterium]